MLQLQVIASLLLDTFVTCQLLAGNAVIVDERSCNLKHINSILFGDSKQAYLCKMGKKSISEQKKKQVCRLLKDGLSCREIMAQTGISKSSVSNIRKELTNLPETGHTGRPLKLNNRERRKIIKLANKKGIDNAEQINRELESTLNIKVSTNTVRRVLKAEGYVASRKKKKALLSRAHRRARVEFAKTYVSWTVEDWKKVFSDETKVNMLSSDGPNYIWKKPGSDLSEKHIQPTLKFGGGHIMVWSCFCYKGVGYETQIMGTPSSGIH